MGTTHGKKNNHINLGEIGMERFWVKKWMVNECFFWKDHLFEPISLYNRLAAWGSQVASKGDETNPLKACGWFSGWSFPLGRCWVIKVSLEEITCPCSKFQFPSQVLFEEFMQKNDNFR